VGDRVFLAGGDPYRTGAIALFRCHTSPSAPQGPGRYMESPDKSLRISSICGLLAGPVVVAFWIVAVLAQPRAFSFVDHASSDLGAETADSAWIANQLGSNLPGVLLLVFAVGLWRSVGDHLSARIGSILIALVGAGVFISGFLRLDCGRINPGCEDTSWHAAGHNINSGITVLALVVAPFVLSRAFKLAPSWHDRWLPTLGAGIATVAAAIVGGAVGEGLGQFLALSVWFAWIALLALRMLGLSVSAAATGPSS
jgi:hypothetical protein